jgi:hypothetical protein
LISTFQLPIIFGDWARAMAAKQVWTINKNMNRRE